MLRRSRATRGFFSVLGEELAKLPALLSFRAKEGSQKTVESASKAFDFLKGDDPSADPKKAEWAKKHKDMYHAILAKQEAQAKEVREKEKARRASLSFMERMKLNTADLKSAMSEMTSMKAGAMSLLQHCTASHAAEVAIEQGIDVKNVQMVLEKQTKKDGIGYEEVVVGYIDAPAASEEEVMAFAAKLNKACPVANQMHVQWRRRDEDDEAASVRMPDGSVDFGNFSRGKMPLRRSESGAPIAGSETGSYAAQEEAPPPRGMPGSRRMSQANPYASARSSRMNDDEELHLPGFKSKKEKSDDGSMDSPKP